MYWEERLIRALEAISNKSIKDIEKQLRKYYSGSLNSVINGFLSVYNQILTKHENGQEVTANDLYKLDKYWQLQNQLSSELQTLGEKEITLLSKQFEKQYIDIYNSLALPADRTFTTISKQAAHSAINSVWVNDGKNFSQRIWNNQEKLTELLNRDLVNCVVTGKKSTELKHKLMEDFNINYRQAERLVRTETAHIQTQAAADRYKASGITHYKFIGRDEDELKCKCKELDGQIFAFSEARVGVNMPPMHPNCRCCIAPVVK